MMEKSQIIEVFQEKKLNVEIVENKGGQVVVSRMCEVYQHQIFPTVEEWDDAIEKKMKKTVNEIIKPELRKLIARTQSKEQPIKPILTLAGPLPKRRSFTFDLVFMMRPEKMTEQILQDTIALIAELEQFLAKIKHDDYLLTGCIVE